jgi:hypothetical protein
MLRFCSSVDMMIIQFKCLFIYKPNEQPEGKLQGKYVLEIEGTGKQIQTNKILNQGSL